MKRLIVIFVGSCCSLAGTVLADATHLAAEAALGYESNIGHSEYSRDIDEDFSLLAGANASRSLRLSENSGLVLRAGIQGREQFHYDDLSLLSLTGGARYRIQPVPGFTAPWIDLSIGAERLEYRDSNIRDGWIANTGISVGKHFTDRLRVSGGWMAQRRYAEEEDVFDLRNHGWQVSADLRLASQGTLYTRAARIFGDQVSSATASTLTASPLHYSAMARDKALEEGHTMRYAYRFDAVTDTFELGFNYAINGSAALDISAEYFEADAKGGHTYDGFTARAGLLYQF